MRTLVYSRLATLGDLVEAPDARGAFYVLLRVRTALDPYVLAERLIREHKVATIPGPAFGLTAGCSLRLSYGALAPDTVAEGIDRLVAGLGTILRNSRVASDLAPRSSRTGALSERACAGASLPAYGRDDAPVDPPRRPRLRPRVARGGRPARRVRAPARTAALGRARRAHPGRGGRCRSGTRASSPSASSPPTASPSPAGCSREGMRPRGTVLVAHGSGGSRDHATPYAAFLLDAGFDVLAPDARGHGESGGFATFGVREADDILRWAAWIRGRAPHACLYAIGSSMGGAHVLMAEASRPTFCAIVSDSAFATFLDAGLDCISRRLFLGDAGRWLGRPAAYAGIGYVRGPLRREPARRESGRRDRARPARRCC